MEKHRHLQQRFHGGILADACLRFAINPAELQLISAVESFVYAFKRDGQPLILRITHLELRDLDLLLGELHWLNYLQQHDINVAYAFPSPDGRLVELLEDDFLAMLFIRAAGDTPQEAEWKPPLFREYGRIMGRMHRVTRDYQPPERRWRRPSWDDPRLLFSEHILPAGEGIILHKFTELKRYLHSLPADETNFGLVHQDLHPGNFFVDKNGQITVFDFNDCCYTWFIADIAIVCQYSIMHIPPHNPNYFMAEFFPAFWAGYQEEHNLDPAWLAEIPNFMKLRELDLYAYIIHNFNSDEIAENWWLQRFMHGRKNRLEANTPFLDYPFHQHAESPNEIASSAINLEGKG